MIFGMVPGVRDGLRRRHVPLRAALAVDFRRQMRRGARNQMSSCADHPDETGEWRGSGARLSVFFLELAPRRHFRNRHTFFSHFSWRRCPSHTTHTHQHHDRRYIHYTAFPGPYTTTTPPCFYDCLRW